MAAWHFNCRSTHLRRPFDGVDLACSKLHRQHRQQRKGPGAHVRHRGAFGAALQGRGIGSGALLVVHHGAVVLQSGLCQSLTCRDQHLEAEIQEKDSIISEALMT